MAWAWEPGRQGTGYRKLLLAHGLSWDAYVIDYPPGSHIPIHRDQVVGKKHYRLNIVLLGDPQAFFVAFGHTLFQRGRVILFRPDEILHGVEPIERRRVVFSVGWAKS